MTVRDKADRIAECFQRIREEASQLDQAPGQGASYEELREWIEDAEYKVWEITEELDGVTLYIQLLETAS